MSGAADIASAPPARAGARRRLTLLGRVWRHSLGRVGVILIAGLVLSAAAASIASPFDPTAIDYDVILEPPGAVHWFGTDELGRDVFSRVLYGSVVSLQVMGFSILASLLVGIPIGLLAGYYGGWFDDVSMRVMDGLLSFPTLILALAIVAALGPNLTNAIIALAIVNTPGFARLVRGQAMALRQVEFIQAARAVGMSDLRLLCRHMWPSISGNVVVFASLKASAALITESALSFLGLGVQPPTPSWGSMLAVSTQYWQAWWMGVFPGLAIFVTVLGLNFVGDAFRDSLDLRLDT